MIFCLINYYGKLIQDYSVPGVKAPLSPAYFHWLFPRVLWLSWQKTGHSGPGIKDVYSRGNCSFWLLLHDPEGKKQATTFSHNKITKSIHPTCPYTVAAELQVHHYLSQGIRVVPLGREQRLSSVQRCVSAVAVRHCFIDCVNTLYIHTVYKYNQYTQILWSQNSGLF